MRAILWISNEDHEENDGYDAGGCCQGQRIVDQSVDQIFSVGGVGVGGASLGERDHVSLFLISAFHSLFLLLFSDKRVPYNKYNKTDNNDGFRHENFEYNPVAFGRKI